MLLRTNIGAARRFYHLAVSHLSAGDIVKFIMSIHTAVLQCVNGDSVSGDGVEGECGRQVEGGEEDEEMDSSESSSGKGYIYTVQHTLFVLCS